MRTEFMSKGILVRRIIPLLTAIIGASGGAALSIRQLNFCSYLLLLVVSVASLSAHSSTLVLVSIDGFRHDYLNQFHAPALQAIAQDGFRVDRLQPVYPTNTFPTHISMVTGLNPADHGIEDNHFCNAQRRSCYHMGDGQHDASWLKGNPLWNAVEAQGGISATYFWPESEARWGEDLPTYYFPYKKSTPYAKRVEQVLQWLRLPEPERPQFITLYFAAVDIAGHAYGPQSAAVSEAIAEVDRHVGTLREGLDKLGRNDINLMVVSDHGMTTIHAGHEILVGQLPNSKGFQIIHDQVRVKYYAQSSSANTGELLVGMKAAAAGRYEVLTASEALSAGSHTEATVPTMTLQAQPPYFFATSALVANTVMGAHGYPAEHPDMAAFAIGVGPAFVSGRLDTAHQLDIYPVALEIMGYAVPPNMPSDGGNLKTLLRSR